MADEDRPSRLNDDDLWLEFATEADHASGGAETPVAPGRLRSRILSRVQLEQVKDGPLASVSATHAAGRQLCVFEEIMRRAPVGESIRELNYCRVCHARLLAENMDEAPIWWPGCPYADFQK